MRKLCLDYPSFARKKAVFISDKGKQKVLNEFCDQMHQQTQQPIFGDFNDRIGNQMGIFDENTKRGFSNVKQSLLYFEHNRIHNRPRNYSVVDYVIVNRTLVSK